MDKKLIRYWATKILKTWSFTAWNKKTQDYALVKAWSAFFFLTIQTQENGKIFLSKALQKTIL